MNEKSASTVLAMNTIAFVACFAVWMMNGVLVTFLVDNKVFAFDKAQVGWLMGLPVLTGSILRLPAGMATDRWGGRLVFTIVMLATAVAAFALSFANDYSGFVLGSLGFGLAGTSFSVGIAYTTLWFKKERQGTALGIFGAGNAGSAITSIGAPHLLRYLTDGGANLDGWRNMPRIYAAALSIVAIVFVLLTRTKIAQQDHPKTLAEQLAPLKLVRVWRFGLYYFLVFGGFVALAQWLIPYYVNVYASSVAMAGLLAATFSLPSGVVRALGGWLSDKFGARTVNYWVFGTCAVGCFMLIVPRMDIRSPGEGVMALAPGEVTSVGETEIVAGGKHYDVRSQPAEDSVEEDTLVWPRSRFWQEPIVKVGDKVQKKQLLARGVTHVFFQANVWVFTVLVFILGIMMGIGKAAVYKYIPDYFPTEVGVVGGIVGVIGGLGGFVCPIAFGYLLRATGLWTTCWLFFFVLSVVCLLWMHFVVRSMDRELAPHVAERFEHSVPPPTNETTSAPGISVNSPTVGVERT